MVKAEHVRRLLSKFGEVRPQSVVDWRGPYPIPPALEQYYREIGPVDVWIESYGNPFFLPSLVRLWDFQAGFRWDGLSAEAISDWQDDWLVVADMGGDPFILSRSSGVVLYDEHGRGKWAPRKMFPDVVTMATCLGQLAVVVAKAGDGFVNEDCSIRPEWWDVAVAELHPLFGSSRAAGDVLTALGWG